MLHILTNLIYCKAKYTFWALCTPKFSRILLFYVQDSAYYHKQVFLIGCLKDTLP